MPDLVCLHAAASGPATWDRLRPELINLGYRVHCPPLLGHRGAARRRSYPLNAFRDEVVSELDRRELDRVSLVGHSLGAFIASMIAAKQPDRVAQLVLEEMPVPRRSSQDQPPARRPTAGVAMRAFAFLNRGQFDPVMIRSVIAELRKPQPQWWDELPSITAPTLIIAGGNSSHLDQSRYELVAQAVPAAVTVTVAAGHRIHSRAPARWLSAVTDFLVNA